MGTLDNGLKREWRRLTAENARLTAENERLRALLLDACGIFDHYDLPEHALHYRRKIGPPSAGPAP
jgi:regulator of replication initiation timing